MSDFTLIKRGSFYDRGDFLVYCIEDDNAINDLPTTISPLSEAYFVDSVNQIVRKWVLSFNGAWVEVDPPATP